MTSDQIPGRVVIIPQWLATILLPMLIGLGVFFYKTTDAKADRAERATIAIDARWGDLLHRLDRIESKLDRGR